MEYGGDKYPKEPAVRQRQLRYVRAGKWIPPTSWQCMRARAARRRSRDGQEKRRLSAGARSLPMASSFISLLSQVPVMMESQEVAGSRRDSIPLPGAESKALRTCWDPICSHFLWIHVSFHQPCRPACCASKTITKASISLLKHAEKSLYHSSHGSYEAIVCSHMWESK